MPKSIEDKLKPVDKDFPISQRIAKFRKAKGLTQEELADKIGIKRVLLSDYERGKIRIHSEMVLRITTALAISADTLLGLNGIYKNDMPSLKLMKRFNQIEKLPPSKQKALLTTIDSFLKGESKT
jgi:transcriptional regulator with XRE-family HTH domain